MICFSICTSITNPTILDISLQNPYSVEGEERDFKNKFFQNSSKFYEGFFHFKLGSFVQTQQQKMNLVYCVCVSKRRGVYEKCLFNAHCCFFFFLL